MSDPTLEHLQSELTRAHAAIEKLQTRLQALECWLQDVTEADGSRERRIYCSHLVVHPPGQPAGMRWELSASEEGAVLVMHSGAGEELLQIADTPDGRGPLLTFFSHDGTQTVQLGAGTEGGGVVRVANEEGTGLVVLTTDGDSGRVGVAHAKTKLLAALHTRDGSSGLEVHDAQGRPAGVFQSTVNGGALALLDPQNRVRVTLGIAAEGPAVLKVTPPGSDAGLTFVAGPKEVNLGLAVSHEGGDSVVLRATDEGVGLNFWSAQQPVLHLATCGLERKVFGKGVQAEPTEVMKNAERGAMLRLTGTNSREIELNPLETGRQFVLLGDEKLPLVTLGAGANGVQFILSDEIGLPKLRLCAPAEGGVVFIHDAEHRVIATLPADFDAET